MRDRHLPRLCRSCEAPMARQEDTCWRCGVPWVDGAQTPLTPRGLAARVPATREDTPEILVSTPRTADPAIPIPA